MRGVLRIIRDTNRRAVVAEVGALPVGYLVNISEPKRTDDQNAKMWAMLSDVMDAAPEGRMWSTETWKCAFMQALKHEIRWVQGLRGDPLPLGFKTSKLRKGEMADLITEIYRYGDEHGVKWSEKVTA